MTTEEVKVKVILTVESLIVHSSKKLEGERTFQVSAKTLESHRASPVPEPWFVEFVKPVVDDILATWGNNVLSNTVYAKVNTGEDDKWELSHVVDEIIDLIAEEGNHTMTNGRNEMLQDVMRLSDVLNKESEDSHDTFVINITLAGEAQSLAQGLLYPVAIQLASAIKEFSVKFANGRCERECLGKFKELLSAETMVKRVFASHKLQKFARKKLLPKKNIVELFFYSRDKSVEGRKELKYLQDRLIMSINAAMVEDSEGRKWMFECIQDEIAELGRLVASPTSEDSS